MEQFNILCLLLSLLNIFGHSAVAEYGPSWFVDSFFSLNGREATCGRKMCDVYQWHTGWIKSMCCTQYISGKRGHTKCCGCPDDPDAIECCGSETCRIPRPGKPALPPRPQARRPTTTQEPTKPPPTQPPTLPPTVPPPAGPRIAPYNACVCQKTRYHRRGTPEHYYEECWGKECLYPCCNCEIRYHYNKVCCGEEICRKKGKKPFYVDPALCKCGAMHNPFI